MKNNLPKHTAYKTLVKNKLYTLNNLSDIQQIIEQHSFTIIEYKKYGNSYAVSELINALGIENQIHQSNSFVYLNNNLRFVFINADVSEQDKCTLLRHELGHICDPDFQYTDTIKKEEFANEFSCYVKNPGVSFIIYAFLIKKRKLLIGIFAFIICTIGISYFANPIIFKKTQSTANYEVTKATEKTYYITRTGAKYHQKHCIIIKNKDNLTEITLNDTIKELYKPCMFCNYD